MKKFLAVFDGYRFSKSTMDYAIQLTQAANAHLVGVFLDDFIYHNYNVYKVMTTYKNYDPVLKELDVKDKKKRDEAAFKFEKACGKSGINFSSQLLEELDMISTTFNISITNNFKWLRI